MKNSPHASTGRNTLIALLLFLGIGAMGGGALLMISPSGQLLGGLPVAILEHSPFSNFFIPGFILFFVLGLFPCLTSWALLRKPPNRFAEYFNLFKDIHWAWTFSIYTAFALIIWIQTENCIYMRCKLAIDVLYALCNSNYSCRSIASG